MPGALRKSITSRATDTEAHVFVAANSHAAKYAAYIHDKRGQKPGWKDLGIGSVAARPMSGGFVGEKFIERAIVDEKDNITKKLNSKIMEAFR